MFVSCCSWLRDLCYLQQHCKIIVLAFSPYLYVQRTERLRVSGLPETERLRVFGFLEMERLRVSGLLEMERLHVFGLREMERLRVFGLQLLREIFSFSLFSPCILSYMKNQIYRFAQ